MPTDHLYNVLNNIMSDPRLAKKSKPTNTTFCSRAISRHGTSREETLRDILLYSANYSEMDRQDPPCRDLAGKVDVAATDNSSDVSTKQPAYCLAQAHHYMRASSCP